ncbi:PilN domain-containing protein [Methylomagnum ishizawai]|uniref:PilN domain-containing protein n=1 Tax=Methylomagnum ishizawai TaxID=1760988 RepID=UPI001C320E17|nr:PilN domain-containing protein [Methylomagnum ishizawai]BBL76509.1 fimbrial protein [Methylomagnum ishizawai]
MAGINLLPWRAERRKQKQQEFFTITALAMGLSATILLSVHLQIQSMTDYQEQRNKFLESEVAVFDKKIKEIEELETKKKRFIAKMEVIQQLQTSRPEIVHLFDELARTIPEGVFLSDLTQSDKSLTMNGVAQSNSRVSAYMRNLESSPWLQDPVLNIIENKLDGKDKPAKDQKDLRGSKFTLQVKQAGEKTAEPSPKDSQRKKPS